jgi:hypothetical protein
MTRGLGGVLTLPSRGLSSGVGLRSDLLPIYLGVLGVFFRFLESPLNILIICFLLITSYYMLSIKPPANSFVTGFFSHKRDHV